MTATFSVKNFERFQHYKDRSPPWIKLYNELLDDYDFGLLPDASKLHLVAIWLLASRSNNKIPLDPTWIAKRISATEPVDLSILKAAGFIEYNQECSETLASRKQSAMPEERESRGRDRAEQREIGEATPPPSKAVRKSMSSLPDNFPDQPAVTDACAYWDGRGRQDLSANVRDEADRFRAHHQAHGSRMADWGQAWVTWYSNAIKFNRKPNGNDQRSASERRFSNLKAGASGAAFVDGERGQGVEAQPSNLVRLALSGGSGK